MARTKGNTSATPDSTLPEMKTAWWPIGLVRPYPNNPRDNDAAVGGVADSLRMHGWQQPIVVDSTGEIIAGHTRYKAAQLLKLTHVWVKVATELDAVNARAYRLNDNATAQHARWVDDALREEIDALLREDFDVKALAFSDAQFAVWLNEPDGNPAADDTDENGDRVVGGGFLVAVECRDEEHQREVYDRLVSEGLSCRLIN